MTIKLDQNGRWIYSPDNSEHRLDGYYNSQTGWGGSGDNITNTSFYPSYQLDEVELSALYESNWVVTRGIEAPVKDRLAKGVTFLTNDDDSEGRQKAVEGVQNDLKETAAFDHLILANFWDRLYGGSVIYFDFGDDESYGNTTAQDGSVASRFINYELRDSQRGIPNKIWVVDRYNAFPVAYYTESIHGANHPRLGEPEVYSLTLYTTGWSRVVYAHESRCIVFRGLPLNQRQRAQRQMWGNSVVQRVYDTIKQNDICMKAMADTLQDYNYKSLQIENLMTLIAEGAWDLIGHAQALALKNSHGQAVGIHGTETALKKQSTTITGLPEMATKMANAVCGAWNIPYSRFYSAEGGALAGTAAETDVKNYHAGLVFDQEHADRPHIERLLWLLGYDPKEFPFVFPALADLSEKEQLEADKLQAEIDSIKIADQVMTYEEVAISRHSTPEPTNRQYIIDFSLRDEMEADEPEEPPEEETEDREDNSVSFTATFRDKKEDVA